MLPTFAVAQLSVFPKCTAFELIKNFQKGVTRFEKFTVVCKCNVCKCKALRSIVIVLTASSVALKEHLTI